MIATDNAFAAGISILQQFGELHTTVDSKFIYVEVLPGGPEDGVVTEAECSLLDDLGWDWSNSLQRWYIPI